MTFDCATYDADLDPIKGAPGTISIGVVRAKTDETPGGRRALGDDHRIRSADVDAAAGLADAVRHRRAQDAAGRGGGPSRHRNVGGAGLPRSVRPPGDARSGPVSARRRPRRQPRRYHPNRDDQLHRHHRPRRLGLRQRARRRGHRTTAQHLGRTDVGAVRHRQRRPGGVGLCEQPSEQGGEAGARLPASAGYRGRSRDGTARQGRAIGTRCLGGTMRGHQLPVGSRPEGRRRCGTE